MLKIFFFSFLFFILLLPQVTSAIPLNLEYPSFGGFDLNENQDLDQIIAYFYALLVGISGLAAFIMIIWGGAEWMTSVGDPAKITSAKDKIRQSLLGLLLILSSFLILNTINPEFSVLRFPTINTATSSSPTESNSNESSISQQPKEGEPASLVSIPSSVVEGIGGEITLHWDTSLNTRDCVASTLFPSNPLLWDGPKDSSGEETIAIPPSVAILSGPHFVLTCKPGSSSTTFTLPIDPPAAPAPHTGPTTLKFFPKNGVNCSTRCSLDSFDLSGVFVWESSFESCRGIDALAPIFDRVGSSPQTAQMPSDVPSPTASTTVYTIHCTDLDNSSFKKPGFTVEKDTVIIDIIDSSEE